ncbi:4'-phosphopantetheinyl transferase superfamily protein [Vibrio sp. 10N.237.312.B06]|uniref:4'-phosphopantetheinyl transferase family protein n=1 Tax=Vibrio sp. 10N.237.312.B06 TaxID=3229974 RepID=UPI00355051E2
MHRLLSTNLNFVDIWVVSPDDILDPVLLSLCRGVVTRDELEHIEKFKFEKDRKNALITRFFVRSVLSLYVTINPHDIEFCYNSYGKPKIRNAFFPVHFNLSHSQEFIVLAVAFFNEIGVDVEFSESCINFKDIYKKFFSKDEVVLLDKTDDSEKLDLFMKLWTLKESYVKAVGGGLSIPLNEFSFSVNKKSRINLKTNTSWGEDPIYWSHWLFNGIPRHKLAITIRNPLSIKYNIRSFHMVPFGSVVNMDLFEECDSS